LDSEILSAGTTTAFGGTVVGEQENTSIARRALSGIFTALRWSLVITWACGISGTASMAQAVESSLSGKILDPSNAAVAGAQIIAIPEGRTTGLQTTSDLMGQFTLKLVPGKYSVRVVAKDFLEISQTVEIGKCSANDRLFSAPPRSSSIG
jgi:hypothetical protein